MTLDQKLSALKERSGAALKEAREARAAENRRLMPQVSAWVDEMREAFGADCTVAYASEGGRTIGKKSEAGIKLSETCAHGRVEKSVDTIHESDMIRPVPQHHRRKK